ncbi:MAG: hypothetical protein U0667_10820 [Chloroflexota bacterium]
MRTRRPTAAVVAAVAFAPLTPATATDLAAATGSGAGLTVGNGQASGRGGRGPSWT